MMRCTRSERSCWQQKQNAGQYDQHPLPALHSMQTRVLPTRPHPLDQGRYVLWSTVVVRALCKRRARLARIVVRARELLRQ